MRCLLVKHCRKRISNPMKGQRDLPTKNTKTCGERSTDSSSFGVFGGSLWIFASFRACRPWRVFRGQIAFSAKANAASDNCQTPRRLIFA
jgi:hypothetical protein